MSNIRFETLRLTNFKGVQQMLFSMKGVDALILGGKNGYGKSTIFDAIELVLTGKIERYSDYKDSFTNKKFSLAKIDKPLVCSNDAPIVQVDLYLSTQDGREQKSLILTRQAKTRDMKNPVDFDVFKNLYVRENENDDLVVADENLLSRYGIDHLIYNYQALNYVGQEECTRFLKSKDGDRIENIRYLFNTSYYDRQTDKIDKFALPILKGKLDEFSRKKTTLESVIAEVNGFGVADNAKGIQYLRLFDEKIDIPWDGESPDLKNEDFAQVLSEGGVLDRIQWFVEKKEEYRKYSKFVFVNDILSSISDYAVYLQYKDKGERIALFQKYQELVVHPFHHLELNGILNYKFELDSLLIEVVSQKTYDQIQLKLIECQNSYRGSDHAEKAYNELLELRNRLARKLQDYSSRLSIHTCPVCGQSYEDTSSLLNAVNDALQTQFASIAVIAEQASKNYVDLKTMIAETMTTIDEWFGRQGITQSVSERYAQLDARFLESKLAALRKRGVISDDFKEETVEQTEVKFRGTLQRWLEPFDETLDYNSLREIRDTFVRYIPKDNLTVQTIGQKRAYLTMLWGRQKVKQLEELNKQKTVLEHSIERCTTLIDNVKKVKKCIVKQRNEYLRKVTSDIEILFYIYSGRIMQDNFYGRGLNMKHVPDKYVYFVTKYQSDVDALYTMSSGQLVALVLAFTLSLNKLYAQTRFIAVDDPVQTIDDLNVWGFVETLRHEFHDHQILLSTHELNHGAFLRYKLGNFGIKAEYRDMMKERIKQ